MNESATLYISIFDLAQYVQIIKVLRYLLQLVP